jgi:hypothetical protein
VAAQRCRCRCRYARADICVAFLQKRCDSLHDQRLLLREAVNELAECTVVEAAVAHERLDNRFDFDLD